MDKPPRVLMVIETYPRAGASEYSGAGAQLRALAPRLQAAGVEVQVLTSQSGRDDAVKEEDGIPVIRLGSGDGPSWSARFAQRVPRWMLEHRREWDIVHIHGMTRTALAALAAARVLGKRSLLKFTLLGSDDALTVRASRLGKLKLALLGLADVYAAPSTALREAAIGAGLAAERIIRIPNGVDVERFAPVDGEEKAHARREAFESLGWPPDALVALFVGVIEPRKGVDLLAAAWPAVVGRVPGARLLLVGPRDGARAETAARFEGALRAAGVAETAAMMGFTEEPELYYRAADVFVFPSRGEGLPNALIEAHAAGLPSVAAEIKGVTDDVIEDGGTGFVVPQEDSGALARALFTLMEDEVLRAKIGRDARRRAVERFAMDAVVRQYADLYARIV